MVSLALMFQVQELEPSTGEFGITLLYPGAGVEEER